MAVMILLGLVGCGGERSRTAAASAPRDSSGVVIREYTAAEWEATPTWTLSAAPLAMMTDDGRGSVQPGAAVAGALLADGRVAVALDQPVALVMFNAVGGLLGQMGGPGNGPGEYQRLTQVLRLGADTVFAFDAGQSKGLRYRGDGVALGERDFPSFRDHPGVLRGRLDDGSFVLTVERPAATVPNPGGAFRDSLAVIASHDRRWDTLLVTEGASRMAIAPGGSRPRIYGPVTQVAVAGDRIYVATAERFAIAGYDGAGALKTMIRVAIPTRAVGALDRDKYKATIMAGLTSGSSTISPEALQQQLAALDAVPFADSLPAIGQLLVDGRGRLWVNSGFSLADSSRQWGVFDRGGELVGKVATPQGSVLAIGNDRLLLRRMDDRNGTVKLEVWGVEVTR